MTLKELVDSVGAKRLKEEIRRYLDTVEVRDSSSLGPTTPSLKTNHLIHSYPIANGSVVGPQRRIAGEFRALQGPSGTGAGQKKTVNKQEARRGQRRAEIGSFGECYEHLQHNRISRIEQERMS